MIIVRYSVTAITSRFHRGDRGSTPRIGVFFLLVQLKIFSTISKIVDRSKYLINYHFIFLKNSYIYTFINYITVLHCIVHLGIDYPSFFFFICPKHLLFVK